MANAELRTYNPEKVTASFVVPSGSINLRPGLIEGENLAIVKDVGKWIRVPDAQGNAIRVRQHNTGGTLTATYDQGSKTNLLLSQVFNQDQIDELQVGVVRIKDLNGTTLVVCTGVFLPDTPPATYGTALGNRVWVFECTTINDQIGDQKPVVDSV